MEKGQNQKLFLKYKEDFEKARRYWDAFWEGEIIDRPLLVINIQKSRKEIQPPYISGINGDFRTPCEKFEEFCSNTIFFAESIPFLDHILDRIRLHIF